MIGTLIASLALALLSYFAASATDAIKACKAKVSCKCGHLGPYTVYVVDAVDADRCSRSLTEQCFTCRHRRLSHRPDPYPAPMAHVQTREQGPATANPNRDREGATSANLQSSIPNHQSPPGGSIDVVA